MPEIGEWSIAKDVGLKGHKKVRWVPCPSCGLVRWVQAKNQYSNPSTILCNDCMKNVSKQGFKVGKAL